MSVSSFPLTVVLAVGMREWIPRLFIAAIFPSILMVLLLIFFPSSDLAKCPLFYGEGDRNTVLPGQFVVDIQGSKFGIKNHNVLTHPVTPGENLIFLGIVLDVRSGSMFYSAEGGYSALASGVDSTRALLLSSLKPEDMIEDISDQPLEKLGEKLIQWLSFFLNKYPQVGVVVGKYWSIDGLPTPAFSQLINLISSSPNKESEPPPVYSMEGCDVKKDSKEVSCLNEKLVPKIHRSRGISRCVCVDSTSIFSVKSNEFTIVHFSNCPDSERRCFPSHFEL